jgi:virginiamycin B lyase
LELDASPESITLGPDGALWVTDGAAIDRMTITGQSQTFNVDIGRLAGITAGPDGALWFTGESFPYSAIGRITTSGQVTSFALPLDRDPIGITTGPDGALWFTEGAGFGSGTFYSGIGRMTTTGQLTEFGGDQLFPTQITTGPDNALWFIDSGLVGRISTSGQITLYSVPINSEGYGGVIVTGPDGNLWLSGEGVVSRMTTEGQVTIFPAPRALRNFAPIGGIAAGPDGALWFVDPASMSNTIDRMTTGVTPRARVKTTLRLGR